MSYIDGFVLPLPNGKEEEYRKQAETFARKATNRARSARSRRSATVSSTATPPTSSARSRPRTTRTSSSPSSSGPTRQTRDAAWEKIMADPEMQPGAQDMPFDGKRMFWGGFKPLLNTLETSRCLTAHGSFIWYELITPDPDGAKPFYDSVVGWTIDARASCPAQRLSDDRRSDGKVAGGVLPLTDGDARRMARGRCWLGYINVDDVDATIAAIEADGGSGADARVRHPRYRPDRDGRRPGGRRPSTS